MAVLKSSNNGAAPAHPGKAVELALDSRGITQSDLARQTGISFQRINGIVHGRRALSHDSALRIEQALGLPAIDLMTAQAALDLWETRAKIAKDLKRLKPFIDTKVG